jgi:mRNA interferase RelE/StbE
LAKVEWTEDAIEDLSRLDKPIIRRILKKVSWFSNNFDSITPESLSGDFKGAFKLRLGDWRVVYTIENDLILIQAVGHRREIYKKG